MIACYRCQTSRDAGISSRSCMSMRMAASVAQSAPCPPHAAQTYLERLFLHIHIIEARRTRRCYTLQVPDAVRPAQMLRPCVVILGQLTSKFALYELESHLFRQQERRWISIPFLSVAQRQVECAKRRQIDLLLRSCEVRHREFGILYWIALYGQCRQLRVLEVEQRCHRSFEVVLQCQDPSYGYDGRKHDNKACV